MTKVHGEQLAIGTDLLTRYMAIVIDHDGVPLWNRSAYRHVFTEAEKDALAEIELKARAIAIADYTDNNS